MFGNITILVNKPSIMIRNKICNNLIAVILRNNMTFLLEI